MKRNLPGWVMAIMGLMILWGIGTASAAEKTMYNFSKGTGGWWSYKSPESKLTLSNDPAGAADTEGALKVDYEYAGGTPYLGLGVEPKYVLGGSASVAAYAGGHLAIWAKGEGAGSLRIELRCGDKGNFVYTIPALAGEWVQYNIPLAGFSGKQGDFDPATTEIGKLVIVPGKASGAATVWVDEIKISSEAAPAK